MGAAHVFVLVVTLLFCGSAIAQLTRDWWYAVVFAATASCIYLAGVVVFWGGL